ncbi:hypothetical protein H4K38_28365 [Streptomyces sp. I3(2020)]|nr:hypothetical protein [Streptomyces sp. I3(2020)]
MLAERPGLVPYDVGLTMLSIRSHLALRRPAEAYGLVDRALELAAESADPAVFVDLALLGARTCEDLGRFDDALMLLAQARRVAERPGMEIRLLSVAAAQLRSHRRGGTADSPEAGSLRTDVLARVDNLGSRAFRRHPCWSASWLPRSVTRHRGWCPTRPDPWASAAPRDPTQPGSAR